MRLTVLGGCGAWPEAGGACSGYLVEHDGFRLVVDLGYATMPRLLEHCSADDVDAVFVSHGLPDHCADLNPLLRARALGGGSPGALPVYALPGALTAVLAYTGDSGPRPRRRGARPRRRPPARGGDPPGPRPGGCGAVPHERAAGRPAGASGRRQPSAAHPPVARLGPVGR